MYQWWQAQEQADLWDQQNRPFTEAERLRIEFLEDLDYNQPSLLQRIVSVFRPWPEPLMGRTPAQADMIASLEVEERKVA